MVIDSFETEPYRFLSNFWPAPVKLDGVEYPTVEHAYQAAKTFDPHQREVIRGLPKPGQAKRAGRAFKARPDWPAVKVDVMLDLLRQKFRRRSRLAHHLEITGDAELIEGNTWGDYFWGVCEGRGANALGNLLMKVRAENRA